MTKTKITLTVALRQVESDLDFLLTLYSRAKKIASATSGIPQKRSLLALKKKIKKAQKRIATKKNEIAAVESALVGILVTKTEQIRDAGKIARTIIREQHPELKGKF